MTVARGACYGEGCHDTSICSYSAVGGPTTFKSGVCDVVHMHVRTPFLYLKNGSADYVQNLCVDTRVVLDSNFPG